MIKNLPHNWQVKRLKEICKINPKTMIKVNKSIKYVEMAALDENSKEIRYFLDRPLEKLSSGAPRFTNNDIIFARITPCTEHGKVTVIKNDNEVWAGSTEFHVLRTNPKNLSSRFLFYFLIKPSIRNMAVLSMTGSTGRQRVPAEFLHYLKIPLPSLPIQQAIVERLDAIRKAQELVNKQINLTDELFQSLLAQELNPKGKNWELKRLKEVYDVRDGTHDSPKYHEKGFALITSKNLKKDLLSFEGVNYIEEKDYININKRSKVDKGDVLFAMIGTIGNPIVVDFEPNFAIKNVALFKIPNNQNSYFLKYYLESKPVINKMLSGAKGGNQKFVGLGYLRNFKIKLPELSVQEAIVQKLQSVQDYKKKLMDQKAKLQELFDSALSRAMKGELVK